MYVGEEWRKVIEEVSILNIYESNHEEKKWYRVESSCEVGGFT